jgi:ferric-dicitrate binding protein FerR (iron transport regulator)
VIVFDGPRTRYGRQPRRRQRRIWLRALLLTLAMLVVFGLGIALGKSLNDGPRQGSTATYVRTLEPLPQQPTTTSP